MFYREVEGYYERDYSSWLRNFFSNNRKTLDNMYETNLFPTYGSFMQATNKIAQQAMTVSPFMVLPVLHNYIGANRYLLESLNLPMQDHYELELITDSPLMVEWIEKLESLSGIAAPTDWRRLFNYDQVFILWFVEAFLTVLRDKASANVFDYEDDDSAVALPKIILDSQWGMGFNELMTRNENYLLMIVGSYLKKIQVGIDSSVKRNLLRIQIFKEHDYAHVIRDWEKTVEIRSYYVKNLASLLEANATIVDTLDDKMQSMMRFLDKKADNDLIRQTIMTKRADKAARLFYTMPPKAKPNISMVKEMFDNCADASVLSPNESKPFEVVYNIPKKKTAVEFQNKLMAQRSAQSEARKQNVQVQCPKPHKNSFVNKAMAEAFIQVNHPDDPYLTSYPCPCGALHIGHKNSTQKPLHLRKFG